MTREKLLNSPDYWFEYSQNELFRQVYDFMEREHINQTELASKLNVSKGYISQILNGNFNYTLKKLIEICLSIGIVPQIKYNKIENVIREDAQLKNYYENYFFDPQNNIINIPFSTGKVVTNYNSEDTREIKDILLMA
jgi:transcriptional regulator with XRE-family HTH domain